MVTRIVSLVAKRCVYCRLIVLNKTACDHILLKLSIEVYFAWAGATEPGVGHYYRIRGKRFLIELVNTQADAAGNPANHIHSVYRDLTGDFDLPIQ